MSTGWQHAPKMHEPERTRVVLVDDHPVVTSAIGAAIEHTCDLVLVGTASTAADGRRLLREASPDVLMVDLLLPDENGLELCRMASRLDGTRCLVISGIDDPETVTESLLAGASGFVSKRASLQQILDAIRRAASGEVAFSVETIRSAIRRARALSPTETLTQREASVAELVRLGLTNREIAGKLHLAEQTVKNYVSTLMSKFDAASRAQLVARLNGATPDSWSRLTPRGS